MFRLLLVIACALGLLASGAYWAWGSFVSFAESRVDLGDVWLAPYVDATLTPVLHFEDPTEQPAQNVVLGFVVADSADPCQPSWGTYYSLDAAARALDMDRRIVHLRQRGGDAVVSFGGEANQELATVCQDPDRLLAAYQTVIDRYSLTRIDFDIEGAAIGDTAANQRRLAAAQRLQQQNQALKIWLTLPVSASGMAPQSIALIDQALATGVDLAGVNVMTMNYGGSKPQSMSMQDAAIAALNASWQQLDDAYRRAGQPRTEEEIWNRLGATPMIGQNDEPGEVFTPDDAGALMKFGRRVHLGRLSFWSANRDGPCGSGVDDQRVSNTCSGTNQTPLEYSYTFSASLSSHRSGGTDGDIAQLTSATPGAASAVGGSLPVDDPRTGPYPVWRSINAYVGGTKVVWQGRVYQAKWYTQGNQPDAPVQHPWDTPWRYLGPVLDSDRAAIRAVEPVVSGAPPPWEPDAIYVAGREVEHNGKVYQAKWWTQGDEPQDDPAQPFDHPWEFLGQVDLMQLVVHNEGEITDAQALTEFESRLAKVFQSSRDKGEFAGVHVSPSSSSDIPDEASTRLVVISPRNPYTPDDSKALAFAQDAVDSYGTAPRRYKNLLVFAAIGSDEAASLIQTTKRYLAWQHVSEDALRVSFSQSQRQQIVIELAKADADLTSQIDPAYQWLLVPQRNGTDPAAAWRTLRIGSSLDSLESLPIRASYSLIENDLMYPKLSPAALDLTLKRYVWADGRREITVKDLWALFSTDVRLPRLRDANTLLDAIRDGVATKDYFGYATSKNADGGYAGLAFGRATNVFLDDLGVVIRPEAASAALARVESP